MRTVLLAVGVLAIIIILTSNVFVTIQPGHKGIIFRPFGKGLVKDKIYGQGFHIVAPWNKMYVYDVRIQEAFESMEVLSRNGLGIKVDLSFRFSPVQDKIGFVHDDIGTLYADKIIKPEIRSATREVIGKYLPEELYSSKREAIQDEIFQRSSEEIGKKNLLLDAILIRQVELPQTLQDAIERKLKEEQSSLEYEYRLEKERKEAERILIEANGKAKANLVLHASLTDKILTDKGIEATIQLANSPNTKVIVVGGGQNGLPLILNDK